MNADLEGGSLAPASRAQKHVPSMGLGILPSPLRRQPQKEL